MMTSVDIVRPAFKRLHIQTPVFVTETYGIPRQGQHYQTDRSRAFFKLPFCRARALHREEMDYCAMEKFYLKLVEIEDARMASEVTELLMGTEVPPRKTFIYDHAVDAELDI